jgi:cyclopropane-fatty-acyl-phospholipid synthase
MPIMIASQLPLDASQRPAAAGVEVAREIVRRAFDGVRSGVAVTLHDGTVLHQPDEPAQATISLRHPWVLRALFSRASDLAAGEAVVRGDLAVIGSIEQALVAMDAVAAARAPREWIGIAVLAAKLPRSPAAAPELERAPAKLRGRLHSLERDRAAIAYHYDVSNEFYELWLDEQMTYSCAYYRDEADTLEQAQTQKFELICRKLRLRPGERLLDVGCGWGGLVRFATREYGVRSVGVTLSRRQAEYASARIAREGLAEHCRIELLDYRELAALGTFDKAASVGMVEHVGDQNLAVYFTSVFSALAPGGLFLNHGIIAQQAQAVGMRAVAQRFFPQRSVFTEHYVFPDGKMPRLAPMTDAAQKAGFEVRDVENLREHYARTLREWLLRLEAHEPEARSLVGDAAYRVWRYWLAGSAHSFTIGNLGVVQMLLARLTPDARAHIPQTREDIYG